MKKIINESIIKRIVKCVLKEAIKDTFSFNELNMLCKNTPIDGYSSEAINYCHKNLGENIGLGTTRIVFQINDEWVLKLAMDKKGVAQNKAEYEIYKQLNNINILPKVDELHSDLTNFNYVVSEYVLEAVPEDFNELFNFTHFNGLKSYDGHTYNNFEIFKMLVDCINEINDIEYYEPSPIRISYAEYAIKNFDFFRNLDMMIKKYGIEGGDIDMRNLGIVQRNGQLKLVILDCGLTKEVWNNYYN